MLARIFCWIIVLLPCCYVKSDFYVYPLNNFGKAELSRARTGADTYGEGERQNPTKAGISPLPYGFTPDPNFPLPSPLSPLFFSIEVMTGLWAFRAVNHAL